MIRFEPLDDLDDDDADDPPTAPIALVRRRHPSAPLILRHPTRPYAIMVRGDEKRALLTASAEAESKRRTKSRARAWTEATFVIALVAFGLGMLTHAMLGGNVIRPALHWIRALH